MIATQVAKDLADEHGLVYFEVSAKTGEGIEQLFSEVIEAVTKGATLVYAFFFFFFFFLLLLLTISIDQLMIQLQQGYQKKRNQRGVGFVDHDIHWLHTKETLCSRTNYT